MSTVASDPPPAASPALKRTLGFWQVALYGLGSMLGAGIYALIGKAAGALGNAVWLAFVAAMIGAILTGLSYASLGSRFPKAGGAAYSTHQAFGIPILGYIVGIVVTMSGLTSMATGAQAIVEQLRKALSLDIDPKLASILLVFLVGLIIFRGIRESMWANMVCTFVEAAGLLFIIVIGFRFWGTVDYMELPTAAETGDHRMVIFIVLNGALLTFFSFIGFEDILNVSEEVKDPGRNVPRGLIAAMIAATIIYMLVAITAVSVVPWRELAASGTPLMDVAHRAAPWFTGIDKVYGAITVFAIGNTALLNFIMGSRLLYGMSRQRLLPGYLSAIHPKRHTPHLAIITLFIIVTGLILVGDIEALAKSTVLLLLLVFTVMNAALIRLKRNPDQPKGQFEVPMFVPVLGMIVCATLIAANFKEAIQSDNPEARIAPLVALIVVAVAVGLYFFLKPKTVIYEEEE